MIFLFGCGAKEQNTMQTDKTITFTNGVTEADVWILPETKENLKTTLWGKATLSKVKTNESRRAPLCEAGDEGKYILRMIDSDGFYYSANGLTLEAGCKLTVKEDATNLFTAEVTDENGVTKGTYEMFSARL